MLARVKVISLASLVVMVLPPTYAPCSVEEAAEHLTILLVASIQTAVPVAVARPVMLRNESASVTSEISLVPDGVNVD